MFCVHARFDVQAALMSSGRHSLYNKFAYPKLLFLNSYNKKMLLFAYWLLFVYSFNNLNI